MGAHFTLFSEPSPTFGEPGFYGARYGRYLAQTAAGGTGLIIAGQAQVHPTSSYQSVNNAVAWDPASVAHFRRVTEPVHEHGALVLLQLAHNGGVNHATWSRLPVWSAGGVAGHMEPATTITAAQIAEVVEHFARSAANAIAGGFDGIEVHGAHGYLIHEFLSPMSNRRDDTYGGSLENRLRFATEVLEAVRGAVGGDNVVGIRLVGDEENRHGGGLDADDCAEIAARLTSRGLVDFINVSIGTSGIGMVRPVYVPHLVGVPATAVVKRAVTDVPVFAVHRILTPDEAEGILERGEADAVTMARSLIADPDWAAKAAAGRASEIRACTGCNQGCYGNLTQNLPITCVTNPVVGREGGLGKGTVRAAPAAKRVVVVGGGPAGLEAAWVAASRGHQVTLLERASELGGKIHLAARLPGRAELADFAGWRAGECDRQGVRVELGVDADLDTVLALSPDAVVVATGGQATTTEPSKSHPFPLPGLDQAWVIDHERAMLELASLGDRVVIIDAVGDIAAIGVAHLIAESGRQVICATPLASPALLDAETLQKALPRAVRAGVDWRPNTALAMAGDHDAVLVDVLARTMERVPTDHLVIRTHGRPRAELAAALAGRVPQVLTVGDAVAVRWADRAIFDGHLAGRSI